MNSDLLDVARRSFAVCPLIVRRVYVHTDLTLDPRCLLVLTLLFIRAEVSCIHLPVSCIIYLKAAGAFSNIWNNVLMWKNENGFIFLQPDTEIV